MTQSPTNLTIMENVVTPSPLKLHVQSVRHNGRARPVEYEIFCEMLSNKASAAIAGATLRRFHSSSSIVSANVEVDAENPPSIQWRVWKSFEDFFEFDNRMRNIQTSAFAKMMVPVAFAPIHRIRVFFHQDQSDRFVEKRRKELDYYLQRILLLSDVGDFTCGKGSIVLADFLNASTHVPCGFNFVPSRLPIENDRLHTLVEASVEIGVVNKTRKEYKQEIEEKIVARYGEDTLKIFKKHASRFRKRNDCADAALEFVRFLNKTFDEKFAMWLLAVFTKSLRSEELRTALRNAVSSKSTLNHEVSKTNSLKTVVQANVSTRSDSDLLLRVGKLAKGDQDRIIAFKRAAKALGRHKLSPIDFMRFLNDTFGAHDATCILRLTVDAVPSKQLQQELRDAAATIL